MKLIIGLGNRGERYDKTYHNAGYMTVSALSRKIGAKWKWRECFSDVAKIKINDEKILLAKPLTFMNESGRALQAFMEAYPELDSAKDIIICYDDLDLLAGSIRIKEVGGPGTHNGLKSVFEVMKSRAFRRVRIGINERPEDVSIVEFVLKKVPPESPVYLAVDQASSVLADFLNGETSFDQIMLDINTRFS